MYRKGLDWKIRSEALYKADDRSRISRSNDNPEIDTAEESVIRGRSHQLLHRNFAAREQSAHR